MRTINHSIGSAGESICKPAGPSKAGHKKIGCEDLPMHDFENVPSPLLPVAVCLLLAVYQPVIELGFELVRVERF
jgi:hypothetical protein